MLFMVIVHFTRSTFSRCDESQTMVKVAGKLNLLSELLLGSIVLDMAGGANLERRNWLETEGRIAPVLSLRENVGTMNIHTKYPVPNKTCFSNILEDISFSVGEYKRKMSRNQIAQKDPILVTYTECSEI